MYLFMRALALNNRFSRASIQQRESEGGQLRWFPVVPGGRVLLFSSASEQLGVRRSLSSARNAALFSRALLIKAENVAFCRRRAALFGHHRVNDEPLQIRER